MQKTVEETIAYGVYDGYKEKGIPKLEKLGEGLAASAVYNFALRDIMSNLIQFPGFDGMLKEEGMKFVIEGILLAVAQSLMDSTPNVRSIIIKQAVQQILVFMYRKVMVH
jgi:hypothetical protein